MIAELERMGVEVVVLTGGRLSGQANRSKKYSGGAVAGGKGFGHHGLAMPSKNSVHDRRRSK